jgi:hypothetical protein
MRFVVAKRASLRGEGLGNELLPWAKGWIASQELNARLVGPSWGLNRRRYSRNFRADRFDFLVEDALLHLPHSAFTEEEYRATGEMDFGVALAQWAHTRGLARRHSFVVSVDGMWGGYAAIRRARPFLLSKLLGSRDALRNTYQVLARLDRNRLFVAVHMRSATAGFAAPAPGESLRGRCNIPIPGDWYLWVCRELTRRFRERVQFWFFTDRQTPDFNEAVHRFNPSQFTQAGLTECSDLLLMAHADLRVCSVSSYSLAASFLADGPYVWYEPQLCLNDGLYTLWGNEERPKAASSSTARNRDYAAGLCASPFGGGNPPAEFPGTAMDIGDPLPGSLIDLLERRLRSKDPRTNLLDHGYVPESLLHAKASQGAEALFPLAKGWAQ